jgi:hypothetical protein
MADEFEVAHRTPGRTRLRWCGAGAPSQDLLTSFASSPGVQKIEYRQTTGSLVLTHEKDYGLDQIAWEAERAGVALCEKPEPSSKPRRSNGVGRAIVLSKGPDAASAADSGKANTGNKWSPIVAEVEAVVLLGLILGWIRDWLAGRNLAFGTVVLVVLSGIALYQFWWRRQAKKEAAEPELEFIFA